MAQIKDAPVLVTGNVADVANKMKYGSPGTVDAKIVTILNSDDGPSVVSVKVSLADAVLLGLEDLPSMAAVAWFIRQGHWKQPEGASGMSSLFLRVVTFEDVQKLVGLVDSSDVPADSSDVLV